jgi:hypothetical protein
MAKEEKKKTKPSEKKMVQNVLLKHPEVLNNARHLFRNENGTTIVEDRVPRGDPDRKTIGQPFCQADLTDADLRDLAKYASEIIDEGILRYDEKTAYEDALHRAIDQKDGGKYAGKVGAVTYGLILSSMSKKKASPVEKEAAENSQLQGEIKKELDVIDKKKKSIKDQETLLGQKIHSIDSSKKIEEDHMASLGDLAKVAQFIAEQSPEQMVILKAMVKEAADQNDPKRWQKTLDSIGVKAPKSKSASEEDETPGQDEAMKAHDEKEKNHEKKETEEEKKIEEKAVAEEKKEEKKDDKDASVLGELDNIAGDLEASGDYELFKIAYQLDQVADVLEGKKVATALESDPDEKYMREAFNATIHQKEKDEKYMESFATDKTQEVSKAYSKRPYGIVK